MTNDLIYNNQDEFCNFCDYGPLGFNHCYQTHMQEQAEGNNQDFVCGYANINGVEVRIYPDRISIRDVEEKVEDPKTRAITIRLVHKVVSRGNLVGLKAAIDKAQKRHKAPETSILARLFDRQIANV